MLAHPHNNFAVYVQGTHPRNIEKLFITTRFILLRSIRIIGDEKALSLSRVELGVVLSSLESQLSGIGCNHHHTELRPWLNGHSSRFELFLHWAAVSSTNIFTWMVPILRQAHAHPLDGSAYGPTMDPRFSRESNNPT